MAFAIFLPVLTKLLTVLSNEMLTIVKLDFPNFAYTFLTSGISAKQGEHHVAQNCRR